MTAPACSIKARCLADRSDRSQEQADAYRYLAGLFASDPKLASIVEFERDRSVNLACEYDNDADDLREQALLAGFDPERDL